MKWSWRVAQFKGIGVYIHATFLLLLGFFFFAYMQQGGWARGLEGVALVLLLFSCVVAHEYGHALTARRYGIRTRDITLYPIGGIARLERIPRNPRQELLIAIAGPAVNVAIAAVLFLGLTAADAPVGREALSVQGGNFWTKLMWWNLWMVGFNAIPAFPMDGGRVLRAFLAERIEYGRATQIASGVGQALAFAFGFVGLAGIPILGVQPNPFLIFIAFFVYMAAGEEAATVQAERAFRGVPVRGAMMTNLLTLTPSDTLARATELLLAGAQHDFPVVEVGKMVGLLTRRNLVAALGEKGPGGAVTDAMQVAMNPVAPGDSLESTFQRMREIEAPALPVEENGQLVGLISLENIGEFLMVRSALEGPNPADSRASDGLAGGVKEWTWRWWRSGKRARG